MPLDPTPTHNFPINYLSTSIIYNLLISTLFSYKPQTRSENFICMEQFTIMAMAKKNEDGL